MKWAEKKTKTKTKKNNNNNDAQLIFIRPRHKEILCWSMKHGFEYLRASQMIITFFLFSQN